MPETSKYVVSFMVMIVQIVVFWDVTPCSLVGGYQCLGGTCCLHLQVSKHLLVAGRDSNKIRNYLNAVICFKVGRNL
jgi:hypothetical protein